MNDKSISVHQFIEMYALKSELKTEVHRGSLYAWWRAPNPNPCRRAPNPKLHASTCLLFFPLWSPVPLAAGLVCGTWSICIYCNYCSLCSLLHLVTCGISYVCLLLLYSFIDELGASALLNVTERSLVGLEAAIQSFCRVLSFLFFALATRKMHSDVLCTQYVSIGASITV
jgi:hypothetical protein